MTPSPRSISRLLSPGAVRLASLAVVSWPVALPSDGLSWASLDSRWLSACLAAAALVALVRFVAAGLRQEKVFARRVLILGSGPMALKIIRELEAADDTRFVVAGVVDAEGSTSEEWAGVRWLGTPDQLAEIVERVRPSCIVVAFADRRLHLPMQPLLESRVRGIPVEDAIAFYERITGKIAIEALTPGVLILSNGFRNHGAAQLVARITSVLFAIVGLVLVAPLLALLAIIIKIDSRGPILFVQDRAGIDGRVVKLLKLRTMHPSAERASEWVQDNTARITRIGHYLRRFRLDELPQLWNIVRGDMNLIGPRPHPVSNQRVFMEHIAYYGLRSTVLPGVTGWAQIRYGYANNLEQETEKMRYDLYYIKNRTVWLDARILFETVFTILLGRGAKGVRVRKSDRRANWPPSAPPVIVSLPVAARPHTAAPGAR